MRGAPEKIFFGVDLLAHSLLGRLGSPALRQSRLRDIGLRVSGPLELSRYLLAERLPPETLFAYQLRQIRSLLRIAKQTRFWSEWFTQNNLSVETIAELPDFRKLPIITKSIYRDRELGDFVVPDASARLIENNTAGSSGTPFIFYRDRKYQPRLHARYYRMCRLLGIPLDAKKVSLKASWGSVPLWRDPRRVLVLPFTGLWEQPQKYLEVMKAFGASIIESYPSQLVLLAHLASKLKVRLPFQYVISYSEQLLKGEREMVETMLGLKVFSFYGTNEFGFIGFECKEQSSFHIFEPDFLMELVNDDGSLAADDELGRVVVTSFTNEAMPFIRYDLGDTGQWLPGFCACGLPYRRLKFFGRREDYLIFGDRRIHGHQFHPIFQKRFASGIKQYQIIQTGVATVEVRLVPLQGWTSELQKQLAMELQELLGSGIHCLISLVESIPPGPRDKHQAVIRRWGKKGSG